jgi:hypothetical protein
MLDWLDILQDNNFTNVEFASVRMTSTVREDFQRLRLGTVRLAVNNGRYRRVSSISRLRVSPGDTIKARVPLRTYREQDAFRTINLKMVVPRRLSGQSMTLGVFGGLSLANETNPRDGKSFNDILSRMRRQESNNDVVMRLQRGGGDAGPNVLKKTERSLSNVVSGRRTVRVTVR